MSPKTTPKAPSANPLKLALWAWLSDTTPNYSGKLMPCTKSEDIPICCRRWR